VFFVHAFAEKTRPFTKIIDHSRRFAVESQQLRGVQLKTTESGFQRILYLCRFLKALEIKTKNTVAQGVNYLIVKEG
jgi:hypothetical protein